ncbi:YczE/YyaS/YitT family protein [Clostridium vincentii]|uniref:Membrane protein YczE n=1 Tax=Clostridium vincentii TaxID=52704 RepID=A0A2T0BIL7_9CLOT|nr:DUF6198 family protein [Clostridium vincentii]PRR83729.1 hypothetical protein CLVI_06760 [Clostridium vincentii]
MKKINNYLKSNQQYIYRSLMLILGIVISAFGMTLLIKSDLGQSTISGISNNIGIIANMKTGTILAVINYICFIGQIIILKHDFKPIQILQLIVTTLFAYIVNLFLYETLFISNLELNNYGLKFLVLVIGIVLMAYGVSLMMVANLIFMPFEGFCNVIALKLHRQFGTIRRYVDICFLIISFSIIIIFKIPNTTVREGTVIYTLVFGPLTNIFMKSINGLKLKIDKDFIN